MRVRTPSSRQLELLDVGPEESTACDDGSGTNGTHSNPLVHDRRMETLAVNGRDPQLKGEKRSGKMDLFHRVGLKRRSRRRRLLFDGEKKTWSRKSKFAIVCSCFSIGFVVFWILFGGKSSDNAGSGLDKDAITIFTIALGTQEDGRTSRMDGRELQRSIKRYLTFALPGNVILFTEGSQCTKGLEDFREIRCISFESSTPSSRWIFRQIARFALTELIVYVNPAVKFSRTILGNIEATSRIFEDFALYSKNPNQGVATYERQKIMAGPLEDSIDFIAFKGKLYHCPSMERSPVVLQELELDMLTCLQSTVGVKVIDGTLSSQVSRFDMAVSPMLPMNISKRYAMIGRSSCAHYAIQGRCPKCHFEQNKQVTPAGLAACLANVQNFVGFASLNRRQLDEFYNWYCWATSDGMQNFFVMAEDLQAYTYLLGIGVHTFLPHLPERQAEKLKKDNWESSVIHAKVIAVRNTLEAGFHVVHFRPNTIWLQNPFSIIRSECDVTILSGSVDEPLGNFLVLKSTSPAMTVWRHAKACMKQSLIVSRAGGRSSSTTLAAVEDFCLYRGLAEEFPVASRASACTIDRELIGTYRSFFTDHVHQKQGIWPFFLRFDEYQSEETKLVIQAQDMWHDNHEHCIRLPEVTMPGTTSSGFELIIRVLTFSRHEALRRLLHSLVNADYNNSMDVNITLQVSVDLPGAGATDAVLSSHAKVVEVVQSFKWSHGVYEPIIQKHPIGLLGQWIGSWNPSHDREILLVLEDDTEVAPVYFQVLQKMVRHYFLDPSQYDPRLYGFGFQRQHTVIGRQRESPSPKNITRELDGIVFYKYQLLCTWGAVFFPNHWKEFLGWFVQRRQDSSYEPCLPNSVATLWYKSQGKGARMWSIWFIRFAFERGWYNLYLNPKDGSALVRNHRESGLNFKKGKGPNSPLATEKSLAPMSLPSSEQIPLFDYFLNRITGAGALEARIKQYAGFSSEEMCDTGKIRG